MDEFTISLLRAVVAHLHLQSGMTVAREMFGKGYFALGTGEKLVVDQAVTQMVGGNFHSLTAEALAAQKPQHPVGFGFPTTDKDPAG